MQGIDIKKKKKWPFVMAIIVAIILIIVGIVIYFVWSKLSKVNYVDIDKSDLDVNNDIYKDVKDVVTEEEFKEITSFVLFGIDSKDMNNINAGRSDTIIVASINPKNNSIKLISIPRDTYVTVPGYGKTKINHAYAYGGEQLSIKTINNNFGLNITEYTTIDFTGLINIINDVGGIKLKITEEEMNYVNKYSYESYNMTGNKKALLTDYGEVTLTGEQALTHSRNRTVGNDFIRAGRQRQVLEALFAKIATLDKTKILGLVDEFLGQVKTNIDVTKYMGLLTNVLTNNSKYFNNVISVQIPSTDYASGKMIDGIYYFVSDLEKSKQEMYSYIYEK
ncbi:MAG: LCP family protein [Clostridia bacterium]|nr:LCP family protein [Clostridia bacterium]